jgi:pectate lyase
LCAQPLAFPGADGFGRHTWGGRGGKVLFVDNLNDSGQGSLRAAIDAEGARTVIFRVSGTIFLESPLEIRHDSITIAGQSAPGSGVCLANYTLKNAANNVIIRYLRSRMGDQRRTQDDAMSGSRRKNIIIDHCSMSWSTDECASFYDNENFTMQWGLLSESLRRSVHAKGAHGYGGIWGGMKATFHHNLLAHHSSRNPRFCGARYHKQTRDTEQVDFRNNVIYNWGFNSSYAGEEGRHNMVNNYYKPGPATQKSVSSRIFEAWQSKDWRGFHDFGQFYIEGNVMEGSEQVTQNNWEGVDYKLYMEMDSVNKAVSPADTSVQRCRSYQPFDFLISETHTAQQAYNEVLEKVGASFVRDAIDTRIIDEVRRAAFTFGDKGMIDSQEQVGGWAELKSLPAPKDSDNDGMPDEWEIKRGLDPNKKDDALYTLDKNYTNLEVYLNGLVE